MKQKLFTFLLAFVVSIGTMFAEKVKIGNLYYNLYASNKTAEVTYELQWSYDNYSGLSSAIIPSSVIYNEVEYSVTSIGEDAFYQCSGLTSVTIPNSVTSIGEDAFAHCSVLTSVTIPNSVTSIGDYAFSICTGLTSVTIGNSVTSIGKLAFNNCTGLTSVTIPNSVTSIGNSAFLECSGLTSIEIPNSVTSIGNSAFYKCSGLTSVTIGNSVTSIGSSAFEGCTGLTSVIWNAKNCADFASNNTPFYDLRSQITSFTFSNEVEYIPAYLCSGMSNLTSVTIPNSVTSIGEGAFFECSGLTSIEIPNSVTSIGSTAFSNCSKIKEITIPSSVTSIGESAFSYGNRLETIILGENIESIGANAFANCPYILNVYAQMEYPPIIDASVFTGCGDLSMVDLFVLETAIKRYQKTDVWKEFNLQEGEAPMPVHNEYTITYLDKNHESIESENIKLNVPEAPHFEGFTFLRWETIAADIETGISIQAIYKADVPSAAPEVYTNPSNPAQKLIRNGNVYILTEDKTYTITGLQVK